MSKLINLCAAYNTAKYALMIYRNRCFPMGCVVYVKDGRYEGYGIVTRTGETPADSLAVKIESGNTWFYRMPGCRRSKRFGDWPKWIQNEKEKA